jgi:hypothetical protein
MLNNYLINDDSDVETIDFTNERISSTSIRSDSNCLSKVKKKVLKPVINYKNNHDLEQNLLFYSKINNPPFKKKPFFSFCIII